MTIVAAPERRLWLELHDRALCAQRSALCAEAEHQKHRPYQLTSLTHAFTRVLLRAARCTRRFTLLGEHDAPFASARFSWHANFLNKVRH